MAPANTTEGQSQPATIELKDVSKSFGSLEVLDNVNLRIARGEFFTLLGPSGCGKTTLLRLIAGFDTPTKGQIQLLGKDTSGIPANLRPVNTVFQSYALFPHLRVAENVAFGLMMKKTPKEEIQQRTDEVLRMTRIGDLAQRYPSELSGGQKQRVALARAIINRPEVLLLDEPMGALDLQLRKELQKELMYLQRSTGITFIHVTHDQDEALSMSHRIAVLNQGRVLQVGTPEEIYNRPSDAFVATFIGKCNLIPGTIQSIQGTTLRVRTGIGELNCETLLKVSLNQEIQVAIRPERLLWSTSPEFASKDNTVCGTIKSVTFCGGERRLEVQVKDTCLLLTQLNNISASTMAGVGSEGVIYFPQEDLIPLSC